MVAKYTVPFGMCSPEEGVQEELPLEGVFQLEGG